MTEPRWVQYAEDFGAPMRALREATERTGVNAEAFLAIANDLRAIRALLDLALRTNTISGYSMGHRPAPDTQDEEVVLMGKMLNRPPDEFWQGRLDGEPSWSDVDFAARFLSDPGESVNP
jgi:hypothetical protein